MKNLIEILYNLGMLASLSIISGFIGHNQNKARVYALLQGVLFGFAAMIGMLHPLVLAPGLIFDGRSVMLSVCGLFFGPTAAIAATVMPLILRIQQGGPGATMGVLVILSSSMIGVGFHMRRKGKKEPISVSELMIMGVLVHIVMILMMFTLPADMGISTIKLLGIPVLFAYPLATILIGSILSEANARRKMAEDLRISQIQLTNSNADLEASLEEVLAQQDELHDQHAILAASEYTFRGLFEGSADAIMIFRNNDIIDCNQAAAQLLGNGTKASVLDKRVWELSPEIQADGQKSELKAREIIEDCRKSGNKRFEWILLKRNGSQITVEVVLTSIILHGEKVFHALIRDISDRKAIEEQLERMSYHDQLTGVYNRRFFEEEVIRLDVRRNLPITIMMGDVNGLKLVNDSFGHAVGDQLLKKVSDLISSSCRADDIISRIGGDEFVVIFPHSDSAEVEAIVSRIQHLAAMEKVESLDISISFGWATKMTEEEEIRESLKKAEDHLYKKKLFESPSMRSKTIHTIIHTLHEKNKREEAHSRRVSEFCEKMGSALKLSDTEVKELKSVGLLHDIGKIAIDEHMLNKPGKLTSEEWIEVTRHPEIGYRILSTVNEMAEMAEYVLAHHERWDGKGYPKGLIGEQIPLQARIITLADAFDAMTSDRSYRRAMSQEAALEEVKKHAGTQFDPALAAVFIKMLESEEYTAC